MLQNTVLVLIADYYSINYIFIMFLKVLAIYTIIAFLSVGFIANRFQNSAIVDTLTEVKKWILIPLLVTL